MKKEEILENTNTLSFYSHNFRFYFAGFSIAVGIFIILFVLWFFSFNKTPQLLSNPKVLNTIEKNAFQDTFSWTEQKAKKSSKTILSSYPTLYHIGEKQIPSLSKRYDILKKIPSNNAKISPLVKDLRIPEIRTNELKWGSIEFISFTSPANNYIIDLDNKLATIDLLNTQEDSTNSKKSYTQKEIKKYIKGELNSLWLNLKYYWEPIISEDTLWYLDIFYPKEINWIPIWLTENQQEGIHARFDLKTWKIFSLINYSIQSYQISEHTLNQTKDTLLKNLQARWDIDISKKWGERSLEMEEWELIYLEKWDYLVPSLLFKAKRIDRNVILPLYS
jgi:hypothetical protein